MSKKPETKFKEKILPLLRELPNTWAEKIQQVSLRGTPDILGCFNGHFVAIELKKDLKELEKKDATSILQDYKLEKIRAAGGIAIKVSPEGWDEVYKFLQELSNGTKIKKVRSRSKVN